MDHLEYVNPATFQHSCEARAKKALLTAEFSHIDVGESGFSGGIQMRQISSVVALGSVDSCAKGGNRISQGIFGCWIGRVSI